MSNNLILPREGLGQAVKCQPFGSTIVPCDLSLTATEEAALAQLEITKESSFGFFGDVAGRELFSGTAAFISEIGADLALSYHIANLVQNLSVHASSTVGHNHAWVTLRAGSGPAPEFDNSRWHQDGTYFTPSPRRGHFKFVATLKGPGTLFGKTTDLERFADLRHIHGNPIFEREKDSIVERFGQEEIGRAAFFLVANEDLAAIHSEPVTKGPRLFMSVLPGSADEVESLRVRWEES